MQRPPRVRPSPSAVVLPCSIIRWDDPQPSFAATILIDVRRNARGSRGAEPRRGIANPTHDSQPFQDPFRVQGREANKVMFLVAGPGGVETFGSSRGGVAALEVCIIRHVRNVRAECLGGLERATFLVWTYVRSYCNCTLPSLLHSPSYTPCVHRYAQTVHNLHIQHAYTETCTGTERICTGTYPPCTAMLTTRPFHHALQCIAAQQSRVLPS